MTDPILAWHFLPETRMLRDGSMKVEAGYTYTYHNTPVLGRQGLHASVRAIDALKFAPGPIVCRVECGGTVLHDRDKIVCTERTVLWMTDVTTTLHEFACDVVEQELKRAAIDDARCWAAIEAKRRWLADEITDAELVKISDAARGAARDAARALVWNAARDVVWDVVWAAACDAAARDTTMDADWGVWSAAWAAVWDAHNDMLTARMETLDRSD